MNRYLLFFEHISHESSKCPALAQHSHDSTIIELRGNSRGNSEPTLALARDGYALSGDVKWQVFRRVRILHLNIAGNLAEPDILVVDSGQDLECPSERLQAISAALEKDVESHSERIIAAILPLRLAIFLYHLML
ncbi:hypothetical protein RRG08_032508 [Elysia crispata]|uniref:Uncharacterized protein n=1 Tax=Elysia crispata TaxID=231223 RepID=A0AAE1DNT8_9GAST|nr:hypothetical protein RRG08_032508 [Elysia crispata]